jgi:hypothetical protein
VERTQDVFARLLTFRGVTDAEEAVAFLRETTLPVLKQQFGFRGVSASVDRTNDVLTLLSLWANESALESSNRPLVETREKATALTGATVSVEHFEQVAEALAKTPGPGGSLLLTRYRVEARLLDRQLLYFEGELLPKLMAQPGFSTMRNLVDRYTGQGVMGTAWDGPSEMRAAELVLSADQDAAAARDVTFGENTYLDVLLFEMG